MTNSTVLILFCLFSVCFAQQLISLSTIKGAGVKNPLQLPTPFGVYVSGKSDSDALLRQIFVVTGNNQQVSLDLLKNLKTSLGELDPYRITDPATTYLTTNLTANQLTTLNGVMFLSTPKQLQDKNFHVYDVSAAQHVSFPNTSTVLFLNTCMDTIPKRSSNIQHWFQMTDTHAHIYDGYPTDSIEPKNTEIFSNPMHTDKLDAYFQHFEYFSISLTAFYLKTYDGSVEFFIQPDYDDMYRIPITTSAYTTTGFYMKALGQDDRVVTINTKRDTNFMGSTGANILGHLPNDKKVTVGEYDGEDHNEFSVTPNDYIVPWSTPNIGQKIQISSTSGKNGYYYVQYFVIEGERKFSTTTSNVETTTKSAGRLQTVITLMISTVFAGFL